MKKTFWKHREAHPGEYIRLRYLAPLGLSASDLARGTRMPRSRISSILNGKRRLTIDTAFRLAAFLGTDPELWLQLQASWDLERAPDISDEIEPANTAGYLVGPAGVQRLSVTRNTSPGPSARVGPDLLERLRSKAEKTPSLGPRTLVPVQYEDGTHAWINKPK